MTRTATLVLMYSNIIVSFVDKLLMMFCNEGIRQTKFQKLSYMKTLIKEIGEIKSRANNREWRADISYYTDYTDI